MIPMPYILVNMVFAILSLIFFSMTSAALLSKYPSANRWLLASLRNRRILAFAGHGLLISALSIIAVFVMARLRGGYTFSLFIFDLFFYVGFIKSLVLAYQFIDKRFFLHTPKLQRRLLIAILSLLMISVPVIAVATAVVGLFIIN